MYMSARAEKTVPIIETDAVTGLNENQVNERIAVNLTNKTKTIIGKSYLEIFMTNVCTFFNFLFLVIAVLLVIVEKYFSLFFAIVYLFNIGIGLYQDIKAHKLLEKLQLLTEPTALVIRGKQEKSISVNDIVRDEIVIVKTGNQIVADAIVVDGEIGVDESLITGESQIIYKQKGDQIFSGSYVVNGNAKTRVIHVGKENYAAKLQVSARAKKAHDSKLKKSLNILFKVIGAIVIFLGLITVIVRKDELINDFKNTVGTFAGSMIAMIPAGLYLLTSMSLTVGVINLAKKRTLVQEFYSLEMLARSTTLCLDKTGTITDGTMIVKELINLSDTSKSDLELLISNIIRSTRDDNITAKALLKAYPFELTDFPTEIIPFDSRNKYSAAQFKKGTYVIGAIECLNLEGKKALLSEASRYLTRGLRVLVVAKANSSIKDKKIDGTMKALAFIVLEDHIRENADKIFKWFSDNGVKIRVISGDNAQSVSEIAKQVGIKGAENYVSLESMPLDEVREIASQYTVFGRVSPEQKEVLIDALKKAKEVVAMTGDGVNDILALKKADCSIAMASGADAARNVSQLVLLDSDFSNLPDVVAEGRRVINNIQRTSSLFLVKTIFAIIISMTFLITSMANGLTYPFLPNHFYLWEITIIGFGAFFLALEPNSEVIEGKFLINVLRKAIPGAITMIVAVISIYVLYINSPNSEAVVTSMCAIVMAILPLATLYQVSKPFTKYRLFVFLGVATINIASLIFAFVVDINYGRHRLFEIDFSQLLLHNYVQIGLILIICAALYIGVSYIVNLLRNRGINNNEN